MKITHSDDYSKSRLPILLPTTQGEPKGCFVVNADVLQFSHTLHVDFPREKPTTHNWQGIQNEIKALLLNTHIQEMGLDLPGLAAINFVMKLVEECAYEINQLPMPNATVTIEKEVLLEWWNCGKKLALYISDEEATAVRVAEGDDGEVTSTQVVYAIDLCTELAWLAGSSHLTSVKLSAIHGMTESDTALMAGTYNY